MPAGPVGTVWASGVWADTVWELGVWGDIASVAGNSILDLNTRIAVYLRSFYSAPNGDPNTLIVKYLREEVGGEYTARLKRLIEDATA
jgi:hypothetical protein